MQQRTLEQFADDVPMLTLLDSLVPQMVNLLVAVLARHDMPLADRVVEVPSISCSPPSPAVLVLISVRHRRRNSWWKCRRSSTFSSRPLTLVVDLEVLKVFFQDRVLPLLWSRSLTFQFPEVACTVSLFLALQAHPQYRVMCVEKGSFALFPG